MKRQFFLMKPACSQSIFDLTHSSSVMLHAGMQENGLQAKCIITSITNFSTFAKNAPLPD